MTCQCTALCSALFSQPAIPPRSRLLEISWDTVGYMLLVVGYRINPARSEDMHNLILRTLSCLTADLMLSAGVYRFPLIFQSKQIHITSLSMLHCSFALAVTDCSTDVHTSHIA